MTGPRPTGSITDVAGVLVGHHHRIGDGWATGVTAVLAPPGTVGAVDVRGGGPGTRETDLLDPSNLVEHVDAVLLCGGSAYGLAAADGAMRWLAGRGRGFRVGAGEHEVVPIVPAAVVFDLPMGRWLNVPDASFGAEACSAAASSAPGQPAAAPPETAQPATAPPAAAQPATGPQASGPQASGPPATGPPPATAEGSAAGRPAEGSVGAGAGAVAGRLKGGVGTASTVVTSGGATYTVGALAAVNAMGEVIDPATGLPWLPSLATDLGLATPAPEEVRAAAAAAEAPVSRLNTTIGVVATDAALTKARCRRLAMAAHDGLARAVRPAHSMFDGDTVFALATGRAAGAPATGATGAGATGAGAAVAATARAAEATVAEATVAARAAEAAVDPSTVNALCAAAADTFALAVVRGVLAATAVPGPPGRTAVPAYRDRYPSAVLATQT